MAMRYVIPGAKNRGHFHPSGGIDRGAEILCPAKFVHGPQATIFLPATGWSGQDAHYRGGASTRARALERRPGAAGGDAVPARAVSLAGTGRRTPSPRRNGPGLRQSRSRRPVSAAGVSRAAHPGNLLQQPRRDVPAEGIAGGSRAGGAARHGAPAGPGARLEQSRHRSTGSWKARRKRHLPGARDRAPARQPRSS